MKLAANKAQLPEVVCPQCGREPAAHGCRAVPLGWWCVSAGLQQDPATFLHSSTAPDPAASDPAVKQARAAEAKAQCGYDEAHGAWVDAVARQRSAELKSQRQPVMFAHDMAPIEPDRGTAEQRQLRDREEESRAVRDLAGDRLVEARQATRDAEVAARRRRERT